MSNYIVGDIQGCFDELQLLLETVNFDKQQDTLWVAGDLVARGPKSLETLRFIRSLGDAAKVVLGNHDLHLLAVSLGLFPAKAKDNTQPILNAEDREQLLEWLRQQPLIQEHPEFVMSHAGISPQWDLERARIENLEIVDLLKSDQWQWLIENMYSNTPDLWRQNLEGIERYRYAINSLTRMRFCFTDGRLDMACKLPPNEITTEPLVPWFDLPQRIKLDKTVIFGHWAALEGYSGKDVIGLDTGCVWGRLDDTSLGRQTVFHSKSAIETRDTRYEIRDTRYEIRDTRYEIRDTRYEIRDTRYEIRDTRSLR